MSDGAMYECECGDWTPYPNGKCETCRMLERMEQEDANKAKVGPIANLVNAP